MPCPICNSQTVPKFRPFCSLECANRDLHNWLHEAYSLESDDLDEIMDIENKSDKSTRTDV